MKRIVLMIITVMFCIVFVGCGEEAIPLYKPLYGGSTCIIVGIDNMEADSVIIPEVINGLTVTQIEMRAFANCTKLKEVQLPVTLESIGWGAFCGCDSLKTISIPDGIKEIPLAAFMGCSSLKEIEFPKDLEVIDKKAFADCVSLKTLELPESLLTLAESAFMGCGSLKKVTFPKEMQTIKASAFENCIALEKIVFPEKLEMIEESAFAGCISIEKLDFPPCLKKISLNAFKNCVKLSSLEILEEMNVGYGNAFKGCYNLKNITLDENNPYYINKDINGNETDTLMIEYYSYNSNKKIRELCLTSREFVIPDGVGHLAQHLYIDTNLKSLTVPESILPESLDDILKYNPNLTTIYGVAGSDAEKWAEENGINFEIRGE